MRFSRSRSISRRSRLLHEYRKIVSQKLSMNVLGIFDFLLQNIKQQWFQDLWRIVTAVEIERLKAFERKRVLGVVKQASILAAVSPEMQAFLQLAKDVPKVRDRALVR